MSLIKWNPITRFPVINALADDFFADDFDNFFNRTANLPAVNITENKKLFKLELAAPGYQKNDFKIEINKGRLMISAENKEEKEEKDDKITRQEWKYTAFSRSFMLPDHVNPDAIVAIYNDGVLKIELPKTKIEEDEPVKKLIAVQ